VSAPYPGVRLLPPEPRPVITDEREPEPVAPYLITCDTLDCGQTFQGQHTYASAWGGAVDLGWRTDVSRQRRCPQCVTARRPSPTLYVRESDLGGWLRRTDFLRQLAGPDAASVALGANPLPVVTGVQAPAPDPAAHPYPAPVAEPERDPEEDAPAGRAVLDDAPATDATAVLLDIARKQEAAGGQDATAVIAVTDAPTEAVPAVKPDGGGQA
jgi:hypothetical protein